IYSLGATLYYLLSGHVQFPGCTIFQKLVHIQQSEPAPLEELRPDLPPGLAEVMRRLLAKRVEERYQTEAEVAAALAAFCATSNSSHLPATHGTDVEPARARDQSGYIAPADTQATTASSGATVPSTPTVRALGRLQLLIGATLGLVLLALVWSWIASRPIPPPPGAISSAQSVPLIKDSGFETPSVANYSWKWEGKLLHGMGHNPTG